MTQNMCRKSGGVGRGLLAIICAALAWAPTASAGAQFTDPAGDVAYTAGAPVPALPATESLDLVGLDVVEEDLAFTFVLKTQSLDQPGPLNTQYIVPFTWRDADFRIHFTRTRADPSAPANLVASFEQSDGTIYTRILDLEPTEDTTAGTMSVVLPKNAIISLEGHAPVFKSELTNVTVQAWTTVGFGPASGRLQDQMPDDAPGVILYEMGGSANGHLTLEAPDPVRISNGGATTFVFQAHLQNKDTEQDAATMELVGVPANWQVSVQPAQVVPPDDERPIFALVTIPFGHQHGGFSGFDLVATSSRDPSVTASIRFGVLHTPIPFPAGHHPDVYLHARADDSGALADRFSTSTNWMNTAPSEDDLPEALASVAQDGSVTWDIPLGPTLAIGMDFDVARTGTLAFEVMGRRTGAGTVDAELVLVRGEQEVAKLAEPMSADVTFDPQAATPVEFTITPTAESDYIPYAPGQNLLLRVRMQSSPALPGPNPSEANPAIMVGSFAMTLPLNEYADLPVWDPGIQSTVSLVANGAIERNALPGTTVTYTFTLTNKGTGTDDLELGVVGNSATMADFTPQEKIRLAPGESREATVAIRVPQDVREGERLEVILLARSEADPSNIALVRTATTATQNAENVDEEQAFKDALGKKGTPLPPVVALAAIVLAVFLARRRGAF
ncbi:MAG: hypothetical protein ACYC2H_00350 [Thermoplasmatota archaeon]